MRDRSQPGIAARGDEGDGGDIGQVGFRAYWSSSSGDSFTVQRRFKDNTWIWRGSNVMGAKEHRCIAVVSDDGQTINARHEKSDDGGSWVLWMDVTLRKQG
jgi:hypothetical protein